MRVRECVCVRVCVRACVCVRVSSCVSSCVCVCLPLCLPASLSARLSVCLTLTHFFSWLLSTFSIAHAVGPIVADSYCRYKAPVTFPDTLAIGVRVTEAEANELQLEYTVSLIGSYKSTLLFAWPHVSPTRTHTFSLPLPLSLPLLCLRLKLVSKKLKGVVAAEGRGRLVSYDYKTGKKADFPPAMVEAMYFFQPDEASIKALVTNELD